MSSDAKAPIIIKRKKVIAGGHHGGAWKVAYADFVTAMMAFFLLMWLLGATNEKQRKGIADYFNPTIPIMKASGGGDGAFGGDSIFSQNSLVSQGTGATASFGPGEEPADAKIVDSGSSAQSAGREAMLFGDVADMLSGRGGESMVSELLARHIVTRLSDEGLVVEIFALPSNPIFQDGRPTDVLQSVLSSVAEVFRLAKNEIAIQAHVASRPRVTRNSDPWTATTERANRARSVLTALGVSASRMQRVTGFADTEPVTRDPLSVRNNRLEIILLRDGV